MFKAPRLIPGVILAFVLSLGMASRWIMPATSATSQTERSVELDLTLRVAPVVVTRVTLGDATVQTGRAWAVNDPTTPFQADDDWIQNLTLYLHNRTNKTICWARIIVIFPETGDGRPGALAPPPRGIPLIMGRVPSSAYFVPDQPSDLQPLAFLPGQTMVIHLSDYIDKLRAAVAPVLPLSATTRLRINLADFYFTDGMIYSPGTYAVRDPENPAKPIRMDRAYFPGDINKSWPGRPDWNDMIRRKK